MVNVVALESDHVVGSSEVQTPVVVTIASRRPIGLTVDLAVRDSDAVGGILAENNVLPPDAGRLDVVDPNQVGAVDRDPVTAPDVLGVDLGDVDVLDDDVADAADHAQALAVDDAGRPGPHQRLVRRHGDAELPRRVVRDAVDDRRVRLVVGAPVVLVDGDLAGRARAPRRAPRRRRRPLRVPEVELPVQHDDPRRRVAQVRHQLVGRGGRHGRGRSAARHRAREALR